MFTHYIKISFVLILTSGAIFENVNARYASPVTYTVRFPQDDASASASDARPIVVELVSNADAKPIVVAPLSDNSDTLVSEASARVEKILHKPMSFSYNLDQDHQASSHPLQADQQPDAIDYYKYLARLEGDEKDGAAKDNKESKASQATDGANFLLDYSSATPIGFHKHDERQASKSSDVALESQPSEDSEVKQESHSQHSDSEDSQESSSQHEEKAEDGETSASEHKGKGGDHSDSYEKGGGKRHHDDKHDIHDQKGEKVYDGRHQHAEGDIGKHDKKGHDNQYTETGGQKEAHHDENDYHSEHNRGEDGKKGAEFHEDGEHEKGHSTSGEHNIHKKDEYEKKQEFYDESHEGGDNDKDGEFFHEDGYAKGDHGKSDYEHGADHKEHFGKEKHHEKGGHEHKDVGHDDSHGEHKHQEQSGKGGKYNEQKGEKGWHYKHGHEKSSGGDKKGDSEGHGSKIQEVSASDSDQSGAHSTLGDRRVSAHQVGGENSRGKRQYMLVIVDDPASPQASSR